MVFQNPTPWGGIFEKNRVLRGVFGYKNTTNSTMARGIFEGRVVIYANFRHICSIRSINFETYTEKYARCLFCARGYVEATKHENAHQKATNKKQIYVLVVFARGNFMKYFTENTTRYPRGMWDFRRF